MKVSQLYVSAAASIAVIGAVGFAYAQTSPYNSSGTTTNTQTQNQSATPGQSVPGAPSMQSPVPVAPSVQSPAPYASQNQIHQPPRSSAGNMNANSDTPNSGPTGPTGATRNDTSNTARSGATGVTRNESSNTASTGATGVTRNDTNNMSTERMARADRN